MTPAEASTPQNSIIAKSCLEIIKRIIDQMQGNKGYVRLTHFLTEEMRYLLQEWPAFSQGSDLENFQVLIANNAHKDLPDEFRADPSNDITHYRNSVGEEESEYSGMLYIATDDSDSPVAASQESLENIFTLQDIDLLNRDRSYDGPAIIFDTAWEIVCGKNGAKPHDALRDRALEPLKHLREVSAISARAFADYALKVCTLRHNKGGNVDSEEIDQVIGQSFYKLGLFSDELWRSTVTRTKRRLMLNAEHSQLNQISGIEIDVDKILEVVQTKVFRNLERNDFPGPEQTIWRKKCAAFIRQQNVTTRREIPYFVFQQIFERDSVGMPLGDRVESEIDGNDPARLPEFVTLAVKLGLNQRDADDAQKFLEASSEDGLVPLSDLISTRTKRMVEKVAFPSPQRISNPVLFIGEAVNIFREKAGEDIDGTVSIEPGRDFDPEAASTGLFRFIFSQTLAEVEQNAIDGLAFRVDKKLQFNALKPPTSDTDDDGDEDEINWEPVPLVYRFMPKDAAKQREEVEANIEWHPDSRDAMKKMALFWMLVASDDSPPANAILSVPDSVALESWLESVTNGELSLDTCGSELWPEEISKSPIIDNLFRLNQIFHDDLKCDGLAITCMQNYFDEWKTLLQDARMNFIPDGARDEYLTAFLTDNFLDNPCDGSRLMLPTHAFRIRWIAEYLSEAQNIALKALADELQLNSQNENLYIGICARRSPHQQPIVACDHDGKVLLATAEAGWAEHFSSPDPEEMSSLDVDTQVRSEIFAEIRNYLESHPHRGDGLSILLTLARSSSLPSIIAAGIRKGEWKDIPITMHVLVEDRYWEKIIRDFETLEAESRFSAEHALFPPVDIRLYDLNKTLNDLSGIDIQCDIAIIPQFLDDCGKLEPNTKPDISTAGKFDPLLDSPCFITPGKSGGRIQVSTLPEFPDTPTESWSTLVVRHSRNSPVAKQQTENIDYFEQIIEFDREATLLDFLHRSAHWVITIERHIKRQQIEQLKTSPDILTIKERIGAGSLYTMIVSSQQGREFVVSRLQRKLNRILPESSRDLLKELAEIIYNTTREISPRLALQATGISRTTEEIIGVMVAKQIAEHNFPTAPVDGAVAWISLDNHSEWFYGRNAVRADLMRITFDCSGDTPKVHILVVEGKLRSRYEPHGVKQVEETIKLIKDFLPKSKAIDATQWRKLVVDAITASNPGALTTFGKMKTDDEDRLPAAIASDFRDGKFESVGVQGLFALTQHDTDSDFSFDSDPENPDIFIARAYGNQLVDIARGQLDNMTGARVTAGNQTAAEKSAKASKKERQGKKPDKTTGKKSGKVPEKKIRKKKLSEEELTARYQQILDRLDEFKINVKQADGDLRFDEGPASIIFRISPGHGVDPKKIYERENTLKLALGLSEEERIRFFISDGYVNIDVPKSKGERWEVHAEDLWDQWEIPDDRLEVPVGEDTFGNHIFLNFSSPNSPHLLIGGATGSGKSEALITILEGLREHYSAESLRLMLIDPKGTELNQFEESDHLEGEIGWDDEDAIAILRRAVDEMQSRYEKFKKHKVRSLPDFNRVAPKDSRLPWWLLVLDEYADLTSDPESKKTIESLLKRLAQKARAAGIHLIVATQQPKAEVINTTVRDNLTAKLALKVSGAQASRVIMDEAGAESLNGMGDAFLYAGGKMTRIQCAMVNRTSD